MAKITTSFIDGPQAHICHKFGEFSSTKVDSTCNSFEAKFEGNP